MAHGILGLRVMERSAFAQNLAIEIGEYLREGFTQAHDIRRKADGSLVTEVDTEAERRIRGAIGRNFPHDAILGEEEGGKRQLDGMTWYVDPLDGTSNYAAGVPIFAVSLAYADAEGVQGAAIVLPMTKEFFTAKRGAGAFRNGTRILMGSGGGRGKPLFLVSYAYAIQNDERISRLLALRPRPAMRLLGSTVAALGWLAAGAADAGLFFGQHAWDYAGGSLIVQEAGGRVEAISGDALTLPLDHDIVTAAANNFHIVEELKERIVD